MLVEQRVVEVADNEVKGGPRRGGVDLDDMDEAVAARGRRRRQAVGGQRGEQPARERRGVDHLAGRPAGVDVDAGDRDRHAGGGERLVLELAGLRSVERVRAARAEAPDVEQVRAHADLFVGREADPQGRPRKLRMRGEMRDGGHDLRHPRLVVGAEQRVAAGGDDVVPGLPAEHRHVGRIESRPVARERDDGAVVVAVHERLDALGGRVRAHVEVGEQADHGSVATGRRGQRGEHVAVVVELGVAEAGLAQLVDEHPGEVELPGRARARLAPRGGLRVHAHVAQEPIEQAGRERLGEGRRERRAHARDAISRAFASR